MSEYDFRATRLFLDSPLATDRDITLEREQVHYLVKAMRLREGDDVFVFNGRDGEWRAALHAGDARSWRLTLEEQTRQQPAAPDLHLLFVPLKQARLDYMMQKAVEMGAGRIRPVLSEHGHVRKLNARRVEANVIEAAQQCGVLALPTIDPLRPLAEVIAAWGKRDASRRLVACDELSTAHDPLDILAPLAGKPLALLIGPEGGFSPAERHMLRDQPFVTTIPLGPRILRADTAAIAALALIQGACGDWRGFAPRAHISQDV
ncbi:MAG: 16S rRNA (uracil(1498)-N(3))-methyltransferase [Alphaproteobacteria bacterium]